MKITVTITHHATTDGQTGEVVFLQTLDDIDLRGVIEAINTPLPKIDLIPAPPRKRAPRSDRGQPRKAQPTQHPAPAKA